MDGVGHYDNPKNDKKFEKKLPERIWGNVFANEYDSLVALNLDYSPRTTTEQKAIGDAWAARIHQFCGESSKSNPKSEEICKGIELAFFNMARESKWPKFADLLRYLPQIPQDKVKPEPEKVLTVEEKAVEYAMSLIQAWHGEPRDDDGKGELYVTSEQYEKLITAAIEDANGALDTMRLHYRRKTFILNLCANTSTNPPRNLDQYVHWEQVAALPKGHQAAIIEHRKRLLANDPFTEKLKALEEQYGDQFGSEELNVPEFKRG